MQSITERIEQFNREVVKIGDRPLEAMGADERIWLYAALKEEAIELSNSRTLVDQVDACVDAVIFALGGLFRMGLTPAQADACLHAVMDANFQKKAGVKEGRAGAPDAIKPEGWVGPEARIAQILGQ